MLLTIHNLPPYMTLAGVKSLIKSQCNITDVILDNLIAEGLTKRVTVGLADENDAAVLISKLNGVFMNGFHLFVEDIRQKKISEQSYSTPMNTSQIPGPRSQFPTNQLSSNMPNKQIPPLMPTSYNNMPFYMSSAQNNVAYNTPASLLNPAQPVGYFPRQAVAEGKANENPWKDQAISYPNYGPRYNTKELQHGQGGTRQFTPTQQESNWRNRGENTSQNKDLYVRRDHESLRESSRGSERGTEQKPYRESEKTSSYRSDDRRDDNYSKGSRYSRVERSPPRDRHINRDDIRRRMVDETRRSPARRGRSRERDESRNKNFDYRRQSYDNGRNNQNLSENRDFGSKRPYSGDMENTFTRSNNSNSSTFTRTNASLISQRPEHSPSDFDTNYGGPPNKIFCKAETMPHSFIKSDADMSAQTESAQICPQLDLVRQEKLKKQNNWITNVAAQLASAMLKSTKQWIPMYIEFLKKLKACIISRIEVILGDTIVDSFRDIEMAYRSRFSVTDDPGFVKGVLEKHMRDLKESKQEQGYYVEDNKEFNRDSPNGGYRAGVGEIMKNRLRRRPRKRTPNPTQNYKAQQLAHKTSQSVVWANFRPSDNPQLATIKPEYSAASQKSPNFQGEQKKLHKMEYSQEMQYTLEPNLEKILKEEMDALCDEFIAACMEPTDEIERSVGEKIIEEVMPEFKKVVELITTKRILNIRSGLLLRVFTTGKMPKRDVMQEAFKPFDIVRIKKSDKKRLYIVTCANFETFDTLNSIKYLNAGDVTLQICPLNLSGPKQAIREKRQAESNTRGNRFPNDEKEMIELEDDDDGDYDGQDDENDINDDNNQDTSYEKTENPDEKYPIKFDELTERDMSAFANDEFDYFEDNKNEVKRESSRLNDSDVVFLETKNEVVVIDDNDITNTEMAVDVKNDDGDKKNPKNDDDDDIDNDRKGVIEGTEMTRINEQMIDTINVSDDDLEDF